LREGHLVERGKVRDMQRIGWKDFSVPRVLGYNTLAFSKKNEENDSLAT